MFPEPFVSRAKAPPAKRSEKDYGDENGFNPVQVKPRRCTFLMQRAIGMVYLI